MNTKAFLVLLLPLFLSCNAPQNKTAAHAPDIVVQQEDKAVLEQLFQLFAEEKNTPISVLMVKVGTYFRETPYVASTLETEDGSEKLVINLREMDCTTFAENCLAISRSIKQGNPDFEKFASELQTIRYRNGEIDGYPSRLHYFSDWISDNKQKDLIEDVSQEIAQTPYRKPINFMSTHPASYRQLKDNNKLIQSIAEQEKLISGREMYFIPEEKVAEVEGSLSDGDIVGITTSVDGLDISHVGILVRRHGRIHLMHASSVLEKVVVSENTLEDYLLKSKSSTGIMVARPK